MRGTGIFGPVIALVLALSSPAFAEDRKPDATLDLTMGSAAIVLGDGGARHTETLKALVDAGASFGLADRNGNTPLALARSRRHGAMVRLLEQAGAR